MRRPRMRKPCSSRCARILPVRPRETASGFTMASVNSMVSASEEFTNDVSAGQEPGELSFADHRELLHVFVDHGVCDLIDAHVLGDAEDGAAHDVADAELLEPLIGGGDRLAAGPVDLRQECTHDVPLGNYAEDLQLLADDGDHPQPVADHEVDGVAHRGVR